MLITADQAIKKINHNCDGPVTSFVAIRRAMTLSFDIAKKGGGEEDMCSIANALDEVLREMGCTFPDDVYIPGS